MVRHPLTKSVLVRDFLRSILFVFCFFLLTHQVLSSPHSHLLIFILVPRVSFQLLLPFLLVICFSSFFVTVQCMTGSLFVLDLLQLLHDSSGSASSSLFGQLSVGQLQFVAIFPSQVLLRLKCSFVFFTSLFPPDDSNSIALAAHNIFNTNVPHEVLCIFQACHQHFPKSSLISFCFWLPSFQDRIVFTSPTFSLLRQLYTGHHWLMIFAWLLCPTLLCCQANRLSPSCTTLFLPSHCVTPLCFNKSYNALALV